MLNAILNPQSEILDIILRDNLQMSDPSSRTGDFKEQNRG